LKIFLDMAYALKLKLSWLADEGMTGPFEVD
jgi:hypothetical protein